MIHYPVISNDLQDLPYPSNSDVQIFVGHIEDDVFTDIFWRVWSKPKSSTMTYILAIGGGAGGGTGHDRPNGDPGGGGGGGGSSGMSSLLIPSFFLPDTLYVLAGKGGAGTVAGTSLQGEGGISYISYSHSTSAPNVLLQSNTLPANIGGDGGSANPGAGGTGATISTATLGSKLGIFRSIAGQAGAAGGNENGGNGVSVTAWSTIPLSGGAGGAGSDADSFSGGGITAAAATNFTYINWPTTAGAVATGGPSTGTRKGHAGINLWKPFLSSGGAGGGTNDDNGGDGNMGGIGSGGGGSGTGDVQTPRSGNGGPGMVMIISW